MAHIKFKSTKEKTIFFEELKKRINGYFTENEIDYFGNKEMITKSIIWLSLWGISWVGIIFYKNFFWVAFSIGIIHMFSHLMIAFNIIHDANHNAMFKSKKLNTYFGYLIELLGSNRNLWMKSHNHEHHSYVNVHKHDNNIDGYGLLRLCPHDKWLPHHKYQWLYAPLVYGLSTINYATFRDIKQIINSDKKHSLKFYLEFAFFKIFYYSYLFLIPIFVFGVSFKLILAYFLVGHLVNGLILAIIFIIGHLTEETSFPDVEDSVINENWAVHVVNTTGDYATNTPFLQWLVGGINMHVAHHLFPKICHVHYIHISPIIKEVAEKHGLTYREIPTFNNALKSHFQLLKDLGENPHAELA